MCLFLTRNIMSAIAIRKKGDNYPPIKVIVTDEHGKVIDLTGATAKFRLVRVSDNSEIFIKDAVVIPTGLNGVVQYDWGLTDTATISGQFFGDFKITLPNGKVFSAPDSEHKIERIETEIQVELNSFIRVAEEIKTDIQVETSEFKRDIVASKTNIQVEII